MQSKPVRFWILYAALAALILLRLLPFVTGFGPLWGVAHLTFLPVGYTIAYCVLGAIALTLPLLGFSSAWGNRLAASFSTVIFDGQFGLTIRFGIVAGLGVLFWVFSMPTHFLGDGYPYIANLGGTAGHWVKWTEGATMQAVLAMQSLLGGTSEANAETAFRIISVLSGVVCTWFFLLIARAMSDQPALRLLTFVALFLSPTLLLFFGYVESYPLLWGPIAGFLFFSLAYIQTGKGAVGAAVCLMLATAVHLQSMIFYPAILYLVFSRGKGLRHFKRYKAVLLITGGVLTIALITTFVYKYTTDLSFENFFLRPFIGKPIDPDYAIFSPSHLIDILNLILLVSPCLVLLVVSTDLIHRKLRTDAGATFLGILSAVSLLFLFVIDPSLSMPRDWDLFAICLLPSTLVALRTLSERKIVTLACLWPSIIIASLMFTLPYLLVNLNTERSISYVKRLIDANPRKSMGLMTIVGVYYRNVGDQAHSDSMFIGMKSAYPNLIHSIRVRKAILEGNLAEAEREFSCVVPDPFWKEYHLCLAALYNAKGQYDSALAHALTAVQLQRYYDQGYETLGRTYMLRNELNKALEALRIGYSLNARDAGLLTDIATVHEWQGKHDSTLYYAKQLYEVDSTSDQASCLLARGYYFAGDRQRALLFGRRFFAMAQRYPEYEKVKAELIQLMPELSQPLP